MAKGIFDDFTRKYALSKTLRFELKPVPRTKELLSLKNKDSKTIFPKDKIRAENYAIIKEYIDKLHTKFINAALALPDAYIDLVDTKNIANEEPEEVSDEQESVVEAEEKETAKSGYHKKVLSLFKSLSIEREGTETSNKFSNWVKIDSQNNISGKLFDKELIDVLREEFKDELENEKKVDVPVLFFNKDEKNKKRTLREVFNSFGKDEEGDGQNFTTYFSSAFHDNRRNYYKGDGKAGRVATRIVDENLKRFIANKDKFSDILKSTKDSSVGEIRDEKEKKKKSEAVKKYQALLNTFNEESTWGEYKNKKEKKENWLTQFDPKDWKNYVFGDRYEHFLQQKIDKYNFIVGKLNKDINESDVDTERFLRLHKQVHGEVKGLDLDEDFYVDEENIFGADDSFIKKFIEHSRTKLNFSQKIFSRFLKEEFLKPEQVFLSKRAINTISTKCFAAWHTFGGAILDHWNKKEGKTREKLPPFVDLQTIKEVLDAAKDTATDELLKYRYFDKSEKDQQKGLEQFRADLKEGKHWKNFLRIMAYEFELLKEIHNRIAEKLLKEVSYSKGDKQQIAQLFDFAESSNGIMSMTKYFALRNKGVAVEDKRYANRDDIHEWVEDYLDGDNDEKSERCLVNQYYKALKHFVSQKPWMEDKVVLNFDNAQFLGGWPKSQEKVKGGVILRKKRDGELIYYLVVLEGKDKSFFEQKDLYEDSTTAAWEKMDYIQLQNPFMMLPKNLITPFFVRETKKYREKMSKNEKIEWLNELERNKTIFLARKDKGWGLSSKEEIIKQIDTGEKLDWLGINRTKSGAKNLIKRGISPSDEFLISYIKEEHIGAELNKTYLQKYFGFLKDSMKKYYGKEFNFPDTSEFPNTSPFYAWVKENVYDIEFVKVSERSIDDLVLDINNKKQVYLFQIYNKDFELDVEIGKEKYGKTFVSKREWRERTERREEEKEQGRESLETSFFKMLFDREHNLENKDGVVYKLSGGAKMFYRPASKDLKKTVDRYGKEVYERQRYGKDKLMLHVPIVMNFVNKGEKWRINSDVNKLIHAHSFGQDKFRIIALDRGEKNLAYLTVLNEEMKIREMRSLNKISRLDKKGNAIKEKNQYHDKNGNQIGSLLTEEYKDYHNLLDKRQIERLKARKSWEPIEKIASLKEGYLGFIANKMADLVIGAIQENRIPIIVLENLNVGMKQGRVKIEKQIYSKVEEKIAKKLNYLVDKKLGNFFDAWQLTPEIKTFGGDIEGKDQVGIMLYVNPSYTSATCPKCGFRKRKYVKAEKARAEFKNIKVKFEKSKYVFTFSSEVKGRNGEVAISNDVVYSNVRRVIWDKRADSGRGKAIEIEDVTEKFNKVFNEDSSEDLNKRIQEFELDKERELAKWFNCVLEIRNSIGKKRALKDSDTNHQEVEEWGEDRDFIFCPHCYFDSENVTEWEDLRNKIYIGNSSQSIEFNGDANGSYNTGRKGIIAIERIKKHQQALIDFKNMWLINSWPKENKEILIKKEGKEFTLNLVKLKEGGKRDVFYYCVFGEGEKLEKGKKDAEDISPERKMRKYPDLFISDKDWDVHTAKWASENGIN